MKESLAVDNELSRYSIVSRLGAGGMGEVYLAEDTQLNRKVAVKFLPRESKDGRAKRRLIHEAQAAAKLDHPNICAIHEVGEENGRAFIVMQYVEGQTLASRINGKRIELRASLNCVVQVADALAEAHSHGIIHRDIKPENIMLTANGRVKVLDFGLAKSVSDPVAAKSEAETLSMITEPGTIVGTFPYMSPEQVKGEPLDSRSDLFSLGAVLYEMVSGHRPFLGESTAEVMSEILTREPSPLNRYVAKAPAELQRIVLKALAKDKQHRYQSAREMLADLRNLLRDVDSDKRPITVEGAVRRNIFRRLTLVVSSLSAAALIAVGVFFLGVRPNLVEKAIDSIAILPLANVSADPNSEYLSDGITENIINSLSQLPQLRVTARTTAFRYKGRDVDPQTLGHDLNVRVVVTGRVLKVGDTLNIQTELVDAANGSQLWGQKYSRKVGDIFALQEEIARDISEKLRLRLGDQDKMRLAKRHTENADAYELYMKGRYHLYMWTDDGFRKGIEYLKRAIAIEPRYAPAHAALGQAYSIGIISSPREASQPAKEAIAKALEIDDTLAEAHVSLAITKMYLDWDWAGAESEFKRALELNPADPASHNWYGWYLGFMGRFDESLAELDEVARLDPLSNSLPAKGEVLSWAGRFEEAIDQFRKAQELHPNSARIYLAEAYQQLGRYHDAVAECEKARLVDQSSPTIWYLGIAYALAGRRTEAEKVLHELEAISTRRYIAPYMLAGIHGALGDKDRAFSWLEKAYQERSPLMAFLKVDYTMDRLRSDERFTDLLRRVGLSGETPVRPST